MNETNLKAFIFEYPIILILKTFSVLNTFLLYFLRKKFSIIKTIFSFFNFFNFKLKKYTKINEKKIISLKHSIILYFLKIKRQGYIGQKTIDLRKKSFSIIFKFRFNIKKIFFLKKKFNRKFFIFLKNKKNINFKNLSNSVNLSILNILIKNKIFLNHYDSLFFLKNKFINLNKRPVLTDKTFNNGDFLELIFFKNYVFFLITNILLLNKMKSVNFFKNKINPRAKTIASDYLLKKIKVDFYFKNLALNLIEIDFQTLSLFFLKTNINIFNINLKSKKFLNLFYLNLLKWKLLS